MKKPYSSTAKKQLGSKSNVSFSYKKSFQKKYTLSYITFCMNPWVAEEAALSDEEKNQ